MEQNEVYLVIAIISGIAIPLAIGIGNLALKLHRMGLDAATYAQSMASEAKSDLAAFRTHVAQNHATHRDLQHSEERLLRALERIEKKVDKFNGYMSRDSETR